MYFEPDLICGVEKVLVERYLLLIKDNYRKAERATYFLEQKTGIVNFVGIANIRDAMSHLVTLLDEKTPQEQRQAQLVSAEEHLRRAILEPYNISVNRLTVRFKALYEHYKKGLLPVCDKHPGLLGAPNDVSIRSSMREIHELISKGRSAKAKNLWDPSWEEGIAALIEAFDKLSDLYATLEAYWNKYEQISLDRKHTIMTWWGIIASLTSLIIPLLFVLKPNLAHQIREYLGMR